MSVLQLCDSCFFCFSRRKCKRWFGLVKSAQVVYTAVFCSMRGREVASRALGGRARREAAGQAGGVTPTALASRCITCPFARRLTPPSWLMLRHSDVPNFQIFSSPGPTRWRVDAHRIASDFLSFLRCPLPLEPKRSENLHLVPMSQNGGTPASIACVQVR